MAKKIQTKEVESKTVKFSGEAPKPKKTLIGTLGLRSPMQLTIQPNEEQVVDLGISCDRFVSLLPHKNLFPSKEVVCIPNKTIKVTVKNYGRDVEMLEVGDIVLECVVLDSSDFNVE